MGYNAALIVSVDEIDSLRNDSRLGGIIGEMVQDMWSSQPRHPSGYKGVQVISSEHADHGQIVKAAVALSRTKDQKERRRLIAEIERAGRTLSETPSWKQE